MKLRVVWIHGVVSYAFLDSIEIPLRREATPLFSVLHTTTEGNLGRIKEDEEKEEEKAGISSD